MYNGLLNLSVWGDILVLLVMTHVTVIAVTIYLHRCATHRALDLHPIISHFFRFWIWLTTAQNTKQWVAVHRKHHARCETKEDPHSPVILGIKKIFFEGAELYRDEAAKPETLEQFGKGTPEDWIERHIYTPFHLYGIFLMLLIDISLFGVLGLTMWAIQMLWMPVFASGFINGFGHYWGYRNFECPDAARNIFPIGLVLGGEELHNNHHTYGSSARFSMKWWELDVGWGYIQLFRALGLASIKRVAPKPILTLGKTRIDFDTVMAVIKNRFQVMAHYSNRVTKPMLNEEEHKAGEAGRTLIKRVYCLIGREPSLMDTEDNRILASVLEQNPRIQIVYQYQQKLRDIWAKTTASKQELQEALLQWCRAAESSGHQALSDFAQYLRGFTLAEDKT